jgi:hypothetical protein
MTENIVWRYTIISAAKGKAQAYGTPVEKLITRINTIAARKKYQPTSIYFSFLQTEIHIIPIAQDMKKYIPGLSRVWSAKSSSSTHTCKLTSRQ